MGKTGSRNEPHPVSLKLVIPAVPQNEVEKLIFIEDLIPRVLQQMGENAKERSGEVGGRAMGGGIQLP